MKNSWKQNFECVSFSQFYWDILTYVIVLLLGVQYDDLIYVFRKHNKRRENGNHEVDEIWRHQIWGHFSPSKKILNVVKIELYFWWKTSLKIHTISPQETFQENLAFPVTRFYDSLSRCFIHSQQSKLFSLFFKEWVLLGSQTFHMINSTFYNRYSHLKPTWKHTNRKWNLSLYFLEIIYSNFQF